MINDDLFQAINLIALEATELPDDEAQWRRVCRWYSREFHTPLQTVEGMDPLYVLQHYLEDKFLSMYVSTDEKIYHEYQRLRERSLDPEAAAKKEVEQAQNIDALVASIAAKEAEKEQSKQAVATPPPATEEQHNLVVPEEFKLPDGGNFSEFE